LDSPDGVTLHRDVVRHPGAVAILPLLSDGRVLLLRNYRFSVSERLIELPAGTLERGESPLQTARRELAEETGYRAARWQPLLTFCTSPGVMDERIHLFLATELTPGEPALEAGEDIQLFPCTWDEALNLIRRGEIHDAKTLAGLLYYETFLRRR
jgi:ADP-ribose pyrophosphatase